MKAMDSTPALEIESRESQVSLKDTRQNARFEEKGAYRVHRSA
jgi:hypothetical protein